VIAGGGEQQYVESLQHLVRTLAADDRVVFPGWLAGEVKIAALSGASLLASPSLQENFGLSIVEAMALGVSVLVSAEVDLADQIAASGAGWVTSLEPSHLSATLAEALRSEPERVRRGAAGVELVRMRFSWSAVAAQLVTLYGDLVK
jgi:glycosyltransferase involved in cell wall biosynthesis